MNEEWRVIPSVPAYEASSLGRIRRAAPYQSTFVGRILRTATARHGYVTVGLHRRLLYVHRLVAEAFHGPCPDDCQCSHQDGDRTNNRADNLKWETRHNNEEKKVQHGTRIAGVRAHNAWLTDDQVRLIRAHVAFGASMLGTSRVFGCSFSTVERIVKGKVRRDAGGYL
jgi:hypothetical protein